MPDNTADGGFLPSGVSIEELDSDSDREYSQETGASDVPTFGTTCLEQSVNLGNELYASFVPPNQQPDARKSSSEHSLTDIDVLLRRCDSSRGFGLVDCLAPSQPIVSSVGIQPPRNTTPGPVNPLAGVLSDRDLEQEANALNPVTPTKPGETDAQCQQDPWTPTANLKMLISVASPEIRNRELQKQSGSALSVSQNQQSDDLLEPYVSADVSEQNQIKVSKKRKKESLKQQDVPDLSGEDLDGEGSQGQNTRKEKSLGLLCKR